MLNADLAKLHCVTTKRYNKQLKRNLDRFPSDFIFQLSAKEHEALRSQFVTSNNGCTSRLLIPAKSAAD